MKKFCLDINNSPSIVFDGELVASVSSPVNTGRWIEIALYRTKGGKLICHQVLRTKWQDERDSYSGKVCETIDDVKDFFGHGSVAKELYSNACINDTIEVE